MSRLATEHNTERGMLEVEDNENEELAALQARPETILLTEPSTPLDTLLDYYLTRHPKIRKADIAAIVVPGIIAIMRSPYYLHPAGMVSQEIIGNSGLSIPLLICGQLGDVGISAYALSKIFDPMGKLPPNIRREIEADRHKARTAIRQTIFGLMALHAAFFISTSLNIPKDAGWNILTSLGMGLTFAALTYFALEKVIRPHVYYAIQTIINHPQIKSNLKLRAAFDHTVRSIVEGMIQSGSVPKNFKPGTELLGNDWLKALASQATRFNVKPEATNWPEATHIIFRRIVPGILATISSVGLAGLALTVYQSINHNYIVNTPGAAVETAAVLSPYTYFVIAFVGIGLKNFADRISGNGRSSFAMLLHPEATYATRTVLSLISLVAFAVFSDMALMSPFLSSWFHPLVLIIIPAVTTVLFTMVVNVKLADKIVLSLSRFFGSDQKRELAHFAVQMESLLNTIEEDLPDDKFAESFEPLSVRKQLLLLPLRDIGDNVQQMLSRTKGEILDDEEIELQKLTPHTKEVLARAAQRPPTNNFRRLPLAQRAAAAKLHYGTNEEAEAAVLAAQRQQPSFWAKVKSCFSGDPRQQDNFPVEIHEPGLS